MARGVADIVEVVVLAARAHAFLRGDRARIGTLLKAGEDVLELHHAGIGEHQRRIVARHERRRRHDRVAVAGEIVEEARSDLVDAAHVHSLPIAPVWASALTAATTIDYIRRSAHASPCAAMRAQQHRTTHEQHAATAGFAPRRAAARASIRHHRRDRAAGLVRRRRSPAQGAAAARPGGCRQRHRRRQRPRHICRRRSRPRCSCARVIEPVLQLTCRDRNRIALQADLMGAAACGVRQSVVPHRRRSEGRRPARDQGGVRYRLGDADAHRARSARQGRASRPAARLPARAHFFIGAADVPIDPPPGLAARQARRQDGRRRRIRADPILHG